MEVLIGVMCRVGEDVTIEDGAAGEERDRGKPRKGRERASEALNTAD